MQDMKLHYLDNAATTRVRPEIARLVCDVMQRDFANPSSLYALGMQVQDVMEQARAVLAGVMGCEEKELVFTSGGSEGNNLAMLGAARARRGWGAHIITTAYEHPSVLRPLEALAEREGFALSLVAPRADGSVDIEEIISLVRADTVLVAAMQLNNETGAVLDVEAMATRVKQKNRRTAVHVDGVQGFCKLPPVKFAGSGIDSYATSGHKLHAPKGVGALYLRAGHSIQPPYLGGGQERGLRPGTENVPYIAGYAEAARQAAQNRAAAAQHIAGLRALLEQGLAALEGVRVHCVPGGWAGILSFSLPAGCKSQPMINYLYDEQGVCVSSGSACDRGKGSHVLKAMGLPDGEIESSLRVSLCADNTARDIDALLLGLHSGLEKLARSR